MKRAGSRASLGEGVLCIPFRDSSLITTFRSRHPTLKCPALKTKKQTKKHCLTAFDLDCHKPIFDHNTSFPLASVITPINDRSTECAVVEMCSAVTKAVTKYKHVKGNFSKHRHVFVLLI